MNKTQIVSLSKEKETLNKILNNVLNENKYFFNNNVLSYTSIFSSEIINIDCLVLSIDNINDLNKYIEHIVCETKKDVKEFFDKNFDLNINDQTITTDYLNFLKLKYKEHGFLASTILFFVDCIVENKDSNKKSNFIFSINLLNNILMFYGFYIDWYKKYKNSTVGFWSQFLELLFERNDDIIRNKFLENYLSHLNLNIMDPIYFDNGKDNANLSVKNINIKFIFENNNFIDLQLLFDEYNNKIKKIDRTLLSIFQEMEF